MLLIDLQEAKIAKGKVGAATTKIISYLERALGTKLRNLGRETFHNSVDDGTGVRYLLDGTTQCIRFNWSGGSSTEIESVDFWNGSSRDPSYNITFNGVSLATALPDLARILKSPKVGTVDVTGVEEKEEALTEGKKEKYSDSAEWRKAVKAAGAKVQDATSANWVFDAVKDGKVIGHFATTKVPQNSHGYLIEARKGEYDETTSIIDFVNKLEGGRSFSRSDFVDLYHPLNAHAFDEYIKKNEKKLTWVGKRVSATKGVKLPKPKAPEGATPAAAPAARGGRASGSLHVSKGGKGEEYDQPKQLDDIEKQDRISFTDSLEHLEGLATALIKGSTNALFVAGRGGTGKTQTIEDTLSKNGLSDGNGYFKITGSASPIGIYEALYRNRTGIVMFDDCDGALESQDGRNIIKAATDTKKTRKIAWSKKTNGMYDPDQEPEKEQVADGEEAEDEEDDGRLPRHFIFTGRVIFISNLPLNKLDPDGALRTRAFIISIDPTPDEIFNRMGEIIGNIKLEAGSLSDKERQHVLTVVKKSRRAKEASLRTLVRALNLASSGAPNWEKLVELYA